MDALKDYIEGDNEEKEQNPDDIIAASDDKTTDDKAIATRTSLSSKDHTEKDHSYKSKCHSPSDEHHPEDHRCEHYASRSPSHHHRSSAHYRSPKHRHRSPTHWHKSPTHCHKSPTHHRRSSTHHRSPTHHHRSPTHHHRSPRYDKTPVYRQRSPKHRHRSRSPPQNVERLQITKQEGNKPKVSEPIAKKGAERVHTGTQSMPIGAKAQQPGANKKKLWSSKPVVKSWNNWESASFEGNEATQSKFRRLMGIKESSSEDKASSKGVAATSNVLKDLESQYESSRFMTHLAKGAGLGFGLASQTSQNTFNPNDTDNLNE